MLVLFEQCEWSGEGCAKQEVVEGGVVGEEGGEIESLLLLSMKLPSFGYLERMPTSYLKSLRRTENGCV